LEKLSAGRRGIWSVYCASLCAPEIAMALARPVQQFSLLPSLLSHYTSVHRQPLKHSTVTNAAVRSGGMTFSGSGDSLGRIGNLVAEQPITIQDLRVRDVQVRLNPGALIGKTHQTITGL
jgi:hypothetical protein